MMRKSTMAVSWSLLHVALLFVIVATILGCARADAAPTSSQTVQNEAPVRLLGHTLPALAQATPATQTTTTANQALTLTLVLKRDDEAGFQQYLKDVYDPASTTFRHFLTAAQIAQRFGPSQQAYSQVLAYLGTQNFALVEGSANRMTLTVRAARADTERAFATRIGDYTLGGRHFYSNDSEPALPEQLAEHVQSVTGLSNLAEPQPQIVRVLRIAFGAAICDLEYATISVLQAGLTNTQLTTVVAQRRAWFDKCVHDVVFVAYGVLPGTDPPAPAWQGVDGTGQTIGLLEFDTFNVSDVNDYINLLNLSPASINNVSQVNVNGGVGAPGAGQDEVLIDIGAVLNIAPGAAIAVYDAPPSTSFQSLFNAMINGGVNVISNSWSYCEDQTTLADVQSIDSLLQTAAAAGISVFNGSGDSGSTCLDGSANTVGVPADSPSATAVGGTSLTQGPGHTYGSETWWDGSNAEPQTGQGGFGVSKFFSRPSYQTGLTTSANRSVPDVAANADPEDGMRICNASEGGCPTGTLNAGTSLAAPMWGAYTALLNQSQGSPLGALNAQIYPLANSGGFHTASSMGSDFGHVGLGSPNLAILHQHLTNQTPGPASNSVSEVRAYAGGYFTIPLDADVPLIIYADGSSSANIVVRLADANGNMLSGKSVTLAASAGSHATVTPPGGVSDTGNGAVVFTVTDETLETLTFTATDTTDGVQLSEQPSIIFVTPPATSAGISAFPTTVTANGTSTSSITVILTDALGRPTPGKQITISQGSGQSVVSGPSPNITGSNGEIEFMATDQNNEVVTYTAVDVTDGNLPIPGSAVVTFSNSSGVACGSGAPPAAATGFALTSFTSGFLAENFSYGSVNWNCQGASNPTFDPTGTVLVTNFPSGNLYKFGMNGGAATSALSSLGPTVGTPTLGLDGRLYVLHGATTGNFTTGDIEEIDPTTGALLRVVASNLTCPAGLAVDPLSGDLFFDDECTGGGADDPSIYRVVDPGNTDPANPTSVGIYASLPATPNGAMAFDPAGTLYVVTGYFNPTAPVVAVSGTNQPSLTITPIPNLTSNYWVNVGAVQPGGAAKSLIVLSGPNYLNLESVDITANPYTITQLATGIGSGTIGPDGCLYAGLLGTVYKLAPTAGPCQFTATNPSPALALSPLTVSPNPAQGASQNFTATLQNVSAPVGTPVYFFISGANAQTRLVDTDASGQANLTYTGINAGTDTIVASATVGSAVLTSPSAQVIWNAGQHSTFLSLNNTPSGADAGKPIALVASLVDVSVNPAVAVAGVTIQFTVDGQSCGGVTNSNGVATCSVTVHAIGAFTLNVSFAGNATYLPAASSQTVSSLDLIFANGFEGVQP
jgi:kumamolisin